MKRNHNKICQLCTLLSALMPCAVIAADISNERYDFRGFATIGATMGGDENLGFLRDNSHNPIFEEKLTLRSDTKLGLQFDYQLSDTLSLGTQIVFRDRLKQSANESLEWAYLSYDPNDDLQFRIGRIGLDSFMLSEIQNIGFSYDWSTAPIEFYSGIRFYSLNGADLALKTHTDNGIISAKFYVGNTATTTPYNNRLAKFKVKLAFGAILEWETNHWKFRSSYSNIDIHPNVNRDYHLDLLYDSLKLLETSGWPEAGLAANNTLIDRRPFQKYSIGAQYSNENWLIATESAYVDIDFSAIAPVRQHYASFNYNVGKISIGTQFGLIQTTKTIKPLAPIPASIQTLSMLNPDFNTFVNIITDAFNNSIQSGNSKQHSMGLGLYWLYKHNIGVKFQWDRYWVKPDGVRLWSVRNLPMKDAQLDTYSVRVNYVF